MTDKEKATELFAKLKNIYVYELDNEGEPTASIKEIMETWEEIEQFNAQ